MSDELKERAERARRAIEAGQAPLLDDIVQLQRAGYRIERLPSVRGPGRAPVVVLVDPEA